MIPSALEFLFNCPSFAIKSYLAVTIFAGHNGVFFQKFNWLLEIWPSDLEFQLDFEHPSFTSLTSHKSCAF